MINFVWHESKTSLSETRSLSPHQCIDRLGTARLRSLRKSWCAVAEWRCLSTDFASLHRQKPSALNSTTTSGVPYGATSVTTTLASTPRPSTSRSVNTFTSAITSALTSTSLCKQNRCALQNRPVTRQSVLTTARFATPHTWFPLVRWHLNFNRHILSLRKLKSSLPSKLLRSNNLKFGDRIVNADRQLGTSTTPFSNPITKTNSYICFCFYELLVKTY